MLLYIFYFVSTIRFVITILWNGNQQFPVEVCKIE